jgi:uncharacterized protein YbjT (DUF2867 family)
MPSIVLLGATGLVGGECLKLLLADAVFGPVRVLVRRPLPSGMASPKLEVHVTDLERLDQQPELLAADHLVCALGTTIRQAGSQERFRQVDYGIPLAAARTAVGRGARHFLLVSSLGASARSRVFYSRVKGELEEAVLGLGFRSVTIVRPSLLLGDRSEFRLGEALFTRLAFLPLGKYQPIHARDVAAALVRVAREDAPGTQIIESAQMRAWAASAARGG